MATIREVPVQGRYGRYILIWVLVLATVWIGDRVIRDTVLTADEPRPVAARGALADFEKTTIEIFRNAAPSVVYIFTPSPGGGGAAGSGIIWDRAGHVVTNNHVVQGARRVAVRLDTGEVVGASVVGAAPDYDLAVVQLDDARSSLPPLPLGSSADLQVGQATFAIGNPFGLTRTLTTGVVSALNRRLPTANNREVAGAIQTDAAINPGNSGGPLLDSAGRLIGVNSAIISESGSSAGVGFAVPVDVVNRIVPQLVREGKVPRPGIGITVLPEEVVAQMGIDGLAIGKVLPGSSAASAGLEGVDPRTQTIGDVITQVNGEPVRTIADFAEALSRVGIGNEAELTVVRDGRSRTVRVTVMDIS